MRNRGIVIGKWIDDMNGPKEKVVDYKIKELIASINTFTTSIQSIFNFRLLNNSNNSLALKRYKVPLNLKEFYFVMTNMSDKESNMFDNIPSGMDIKKVEHYKENLAILKVGDELRIKTKDVTTYLAYQEFIKYEAKVDIERKQDFNLTILNLASIFEVLINKITEYQMMNIEKGAGNIGNKQIKYSEICNLNSVQEIKKKFVDEYITSLMYKSFDEWIYEFYDVCCKKSRKLEKDLTVSAWIKDISEMYQKRNIIVHNNGIINDLYISKVKHTQQKLNEELKITSSYIEKITSQVSKLGVFLITENIKYKKLLRNKELYDYLQNLCLELLHNGQYVESRMITFILREFIDLDEENTWLTDEQKNEDAISDFVHRYNYWLSYHLEENGSVVLDDINKYIEKNKNKEWYISSDQVHLGISSLIDPKDVFLDNTIEYCEKIMEFGKISVLKTLDWPMFKLIESEDKFIEYTNEVRYTEYSNSIEGDVVNVE